MNDLWNFVFRDRIDGGQHRPDGGGNPFRRDADGKRNVTRMSAVVKTDPVRAKRLIADAGDDVRHWFPENPL